jgi:hypothetical protein
LRIRSPPKMRLTKTYFLSSFGALGVFGISSSVSASFGWTRPQISRIRRMVVRTSSFSDGLCSSGSSKLRAVCRQSYLQFPPPRQFPLHGLARHCLCNSDRYQIVRGIPQISHRKFCDKSMCVGVRCPARSPAWVRAASSLEAGRDAGPRDSWISTRLLFSILQSHKSSLNLISGYSECPKHMDNPTPCF